MPTLRIEISDEVWSGLRRVALEQSIDVQEVIKRGMSLYGIWTAYRREGKKLTIAEADGSYYVELQIPGITDV